MAGHRGAVRPAGRAVLNTNNAEVVSQLASQVTGLTAWWPEGLQQILPRQNASMNVYPALGNLLGDPIHGQVWNNIGLSGAPIVTTIRDAPLSGTLAWWHWSSFAFNASNLLRAPCGWRQGLDAAPEMTVQVFSDNNWYVGWNGVGGGGDTRIVTAATAASWPLQTWTHYALVWMNGVGHTFYVNGLVFASNGVCTAQIFFSDPLYWSGIDSVLTGFDGLMGDRRLYNRALSADEVWALYDPSTRWDLYQMAPLRQRSMTPAPGYRVIYIRS